MEYKTYNDAFELLVKLRSIINAKHSFKSISMDIFGDGSGNIKAGESEYLAGFSNAAVLCVELQKLIDAESSISVELNDEYSAEVTKDGIKVGCQSIDFEAFDELIKVVEKVRSNDNSDRIGTSCRFEDIRIGEYCQHQSGGSIYKKTGKNELTGTRDGQSFHYRHNTEIFKVVKKPKVV